jgi:hypothetical protein
MRDERGGPLSLLTLALAPGFERRTITIAVGERLGRGEPWRDELVSVEAGALDVVGPDGHSLHLTVGALLFLDGVDHVALHASGDVPTVLVAIRRRRPA